MANIFKAMGLFAYVAMVCHGVQTLDELRDRPGVVDGAIDNGGGECPPCSQACPACPVCPACPACVDQCPESQCGPVMGDEIHLCNIGPDWVNFAYVDYEFAYPTSNVWWIIRPRVIGEQVKMDFFIGECHDGTPDHTTGWTDKIAGGYGSIPAKRCYRIWNGIVMNVEDVVYAEGIIRSHP